MNNKNKIVTRRGCTFWLLVIILFVLAGDADKAKKETKIEKQKNSRVVKYVIAVETVKQYQFMKYENGYCTDAAYLLHVYEMCEKYAPIVTDTAWMDQLSREQRDKATKEIKATNMPLFMFAVCSDETNFLPEAVNKNNKNNTTDHGITQINDINLRKINKQLPKELQDRPWSDTEKNIAGRYYWIRDRVRLGLPWKQWSENRGKRLYEKLDAAIKQGGAD